MPPNAPPPTAPRYGEPWWNGSGPPGSPGSPWAPYQQRDYKPGIVPLRPLSVGEIMDGGFATIRRHPRIVFGTAAILAIVLQLSKVVTGVLFQDVRGSLGSPISQNIDANGLQHIHVVGSGLTATIVEQVLSTMLGALLAGIVTSLVGKAIIGQRVDGAEVVRPVLRRFWGLVLVSLIVGLLPFAPLLLVIGIALVASSGGTSGLLVAGLVVGIPASLALGIFLWGKLALAVPAFVLERLGPWKAVTRSWRLVKGAFWR
ncbi:MAG: hypothetical protein QOJ62_610, partial [Actinomycetota bacterium]|nr:hypothetical protein [Actinomycetota bacterium]